MTTMCRYCGSWNVQYLGIQDGLGDYGDSVCDVWQCEDCGQEYEVHCVEDEQPYTESDASRAVREFIAEDELNQS